MVGEKVPNGFGLYDMHGNVWESVDDDWQDYEGAPTDGNASVDSFRGNYRVFRDGSWSHDARDCRSAARVNYMPGYRDDVLGFRLARSVAPGL